MVLSPSAPFTTPSRSSGSMRSGPGLVSLDRGQRNAVNRSIRSTANPTGASPPITITLVAAPSADRESRAASADRQPAHRAMQVGEAKKASRRQRHVRKPRHADDLAHVLQGQAEPGLGELEYDNADIVAALWDMPAPDAVVSAFGRAGRWACLAISALNVFGERSDLLDRRCKLFGAARLLSGRCRCLGRCAARLLCGGGNLLGPAHRLLQRAEDRFGAGRGSAGCPRRVAAMSLSTTRQVCEHGRVLLIFDLASRQDRLPVSRRTVAICDWMALTVSLVCSTFCAESRARLRMSFDTTAKPLPRSPARAASTDPLTASMLVWIDTIPMPSTIFSTLRVIASRSADHRKALPRGFERAHDARRQSRHGLANLRQHRHDLAWRGRVKRRHSRARSPPSSRSD